MVKQNYRYGCPLCGSLKYWKNYAKDNVINRILIQSFLGRRKMRYDPCSDLGILNEFQKFIVSRLERIYFRITGIDIKELIINSNQPLKTNIIPPISTVTHPPIHVAVRPKLTAKIKPYRVVIE